MGDFNKIISLFIGLFVVIFIIAFVLGRVKVGNRSTPAFGGALGGIFNKTTPTPTRTPTPLAQKTVTIKRTVESNPQAQTGQTQTNTSYSYSTVGNENEPVNTIPKTGPELLFPLVGASLLAGVYLKRKSK